MRRILVRACHSLQQLVYPPRCVLCDRYLQADDTNHTCPACDVLLKRLDANFTAPRLSHIWFDTARSLFPFEGRVRDIVHGLKYEQRYDVLNYLVELLAEEAQRMGDADIVMPVPLHPRRLRRRGYNQAALLARPVAQRLRCFYRSRTLIRNRASDPQVGKELAERLASVKGAFAVRDRAIVEGAHILLIDDVITTGATANECARALKDAGAYRIDVLTIARPC